jgi:hypothetical protein
MNENTVNFRFFRNCEFVVTPLGETGIVSGLLVDENDNILVYVKLRGGVGSYYRESDIFLSAKSE